MGEVRGPTPACARTAAQGVTDTRGIVVGSYSRRVVYYWGTSERLDTQNYGV